MERVDDVFPQAPATGGSRFSGVAATEVKGGKSLDCNVGWDEPCRVEILECTEPLFRLWGGVIGDIVREVVREWSY